MDVPAGVFVVTATVNLINNARFALQDNRRGVWCWFAGGDALQDGIMLALDSGYSATPSWTTTAGNPQAPSRLAVECAGRDFDSCGAQGPSSIHLDFARLVAIQVGSVNRAYGP
jgi:hypothetical protein